jgi:hypothetical protein
MPNVDSIAAARGPMGGWKNAKIAFWVVFSARACGIP